MKTSILHPKISMASNPVDIVDTVAMILKIPKITVENSHN
jgi:hypothetical protein